MTQESVQVEILRRRRILQWMRDLKMFDYNEVSRIVNGYYTNPENVMSFIEEPSR